MLEKYFKNNTQIEHAAAVAKSVSRVRVCATPIDGSLPDIEHTKPIIVSLFKICFICNLFPTYFHSFIFYNFIFY